MSKSSGSAPKPPRLKQIDVPGTQALATAADTNAYAASDADYAKRFPQLVQGRQYNVDNALTNLNGQIDPHVSSAISGAGLGAPNLGSNSFQQARSMGQPILAKEQRDRSYFQTLLSDNPQRAFGLSGGDVANLALANVGAQNQFNQNTYATRIQGYNQNLLQNAQLYSGIASSIGAIGSSAIKYANQPSASPSLSPYYYTPTVPYVPGAGYTGQIPGA